MSSYRELRNALRRKRYAEDPEYRAKKLAANYAWDKTHRPQLNEWKRCWRKSRKENDPQSHAKELAQKCANRRKVNYGLSIAEYERMLKRQGGRCAICRSKDKLCVDHCHDTQEVRALLCGKCNTGLGCFNDDPRLLRAAATFLETWRRGGTNDRPSTTTLRVALGFLVVVLVVFVAAVIALAPEVPCVETRAAVATMDVANFVTSKPGQPRYARACEPRDPSRGYRQR
jgi:Recombination endonuclease VII